MNTIRKGLIALVVLSALAVSAAPAFAQTGSTRTITLTEADINASFRVTNPPRRTVTNVHVDCQPGQVVISATMTYRGHPPMQVAATFAPSINNGRVYWLVSAATVNGQPASLELLQQINASISASWRNYFRRQLPPGHVSAIEITEDAITVVLTKN